MTANRKTNRTNNAKAELGDDLQITKTTRRASGGEHGHEPPEPHCFVGG